MRASGSSTKCSAGREKRWQHKPGSGGSVASEGRRDGMQFAETGRARSDQQKISARQTTATISFNSCLYIGRPAPSGDPGARRGGPRTLTAGQTRRTSNGYGPVWVGKWVTPKQQRVPMVPPAKFCPRGVATQSEPRTCRAGQRLCVLLSMAEHPDSPFAGASHRPPISGWNARG